VKLELAAAIVGINPDWSRSFGGANLLAVLVLLPCGAESRSNDNARGGGGSGPTAMRPTADRRAKPAAGEVRPDSCRARPSVGSRPAA
jgi:hypothetical protein